MGTGARPTPYASMAIHTAATRGQLIVIPTRKHVASDIMHIETTKELQARGI